MDNFFIWENVNYTWEELNMLWEEVIIVQNAYNIHRGGSYNDPYFKLNPFEGIIKKLPEKDIDKFIKVVCRVNDINYEKQKKIKMNKLKVSASQLNKTFEDILKVKINI
jgi:hypothetical protein